MAIDLKKLKPVEISGDQVVMSKQDFTQIVKNLNTLINEVNDLNNRQARMEKAIISLAKVINLGGN